MAKKENLINAANMGIKAYSKTNAEEKLVTLKKIEDEKEEKAETLSLKEEDKKETIIPPAKEKVEEKKFSKTIKVDVSKKEKKTEKKQFLLTKANSEKLTRVSKETGVSMNELINKIIEAAL